MRLAKFGVDLRPVPRLRPRQAYQLLQPADRRRHRYHVDLGRIAGDQLGRQGHHVAHAAVDVDPAFDVVLADLADLPGREMGERRQFLQPEGHARVLAADPAPAGENDRDGKAQGPEALLESDGDR